MTCNCECHQKDAQNELKKCKEFNKKKTSEISELKKKLLSAMLIIAIGGTLIGKKAFDNVMEYFQTFDKVKSVIGQTSSNGEEFEIFPIEYGGISPSPSTLGVFALAAFMPKQRRK